MTKRTLNFVSLLFCAILRKRFYILFVFTIAFTQISAYAWIPQPKELTKNEDLSIQLFMKINQIDSVEKYATWLKQNVIYKADGKIDTWSKPVETLTNRFGDCEDLAFLSAEVLTQLGYQPRVLATGKNNRAHVFTIFKRNGTYEVFDNVKYYNPKAPSLKAIFKFLYKYQNAQFLLEVRNNPKAYKLLYAKNFKRKNN